MNLNRDLDTALAFGASVRLKNYQSQIVVSIQIGKNAQSYSITNRQSKIINRKS
ncbi:MAG: hypothetical protein HYZ21_09780 [Chloroflexi bacterium]|nr:hypothetical protein [Chloroflexota bacterium]